MAYTINKNYTILAYLNTLLIYNEANNITDVSIVSLNKGEWIHLINCIRANVDQCAVLFNLDLSKGNIADYKGLTIYYDGSERFDHDYTYNLEDMRRNLERRVRENTQQGQNDYGQEPEPLLHWGVTTTDAPAPRPGTYGEAVAVARTALNQTIRN